MSAVTLRDRQPTFVLLLAVGLAFAAQYLFTGEILTRNIDSDGWNWPEKNDLAVGLLIAAIGCAMWAARQQAIAFAPRPMLNTRPLSRRLLYCLGGAAGCYVISLLIYYFFGENLLAQLAWFAGMLLLIIPLWLGLRGNAEIIPLAWWEWALVAGVTAIGFFLRYWQLTEIPSHVDNDVALMGTFGLRLIETGNYNWVGYTLSQHLLSYDQLMAWSMRLFGENHYGVVMFSVLSGTATLPLVYLLGREMFNWRVGLISMALLTINYTHIHFSRTLFGPTATFLAIIVFYALLRGMRTQERFWFGLSGLVTGFGILFYDSSRVVPMIAIGVFAWRMFWQGETARANFVNWVVYGLGALIGFGPMLVFALSNFALFTGRGNIVALWSEAIWKHSYEKYEAASAADVWIQQIRRTFLTFHLYGDASPHFTFPKPMVSGVMAALLIIGLGYCLWHIRQPRSFILVAWIVVTFILGGVITYDPPYWPHLNITLPAVAIIAGLAADKIMGLFSLNDLDRKLTWVVALALLIFTGVNNWNVYYAYVKDNADPRIRIARWINRELPEGYYAYLVSDGVHWEEYAFQFFNRGMPGRAITVEELKAQMPAPDQPLVFILMINQEFVSDLQNYYPTGVAADHYDNNEEKDFVSFVVTPPGAVLKPRITEINPLRLPGWWLVAVFLVGLAVRAGTSIIQQRRAGIGAKTQEVTTKL